MMNFQDTIAAISTAPGTGAIAVVRLSGPEAFSIARKIFSSGKRGSQNDEIELKSNFATHGFIYDRATSEPIDEVVLTPFKAPHTYTGEDLVEISCHGAPVITAEILAVALRGGARLARRGEFTQRAFLSGRLDLTQAEAVLDVIQAKTSRQGRRALSALSGSLGNRIKKVRIDLMEIMARVVAGLDFPEEIGDAPEPQIAEVTSASIQTLEELARTARTGRYLREGLRVAIVGRPNAGKSSLLNQLLKFERAIVTDVPGTTRDSLEETLDLNGIPVVLVDTAGIRPTDDKVEKIGIERTKQAIVDCDLVLFVVDLSQGWQEPEAEILRMIDDKPFLLIGNKIDLHSADEVDATPLPANCAARIYISAMTGTSVSQLTGSIESFVFQDQTMRDGPSLNARQAELCLKAVDALRSVQKTLSAGYPQDCLATDFKGAVDALSEISGESVSEEIITQVFATFCIGK